MVQFVICDCNNRTDPCPGSNQDKIISFHRIPAVHDREGQKDFELRKRRQDGYLVVIHREDLNIHALDQYRICLKRFWSGKTVLPNKPKLAINFAPWTQR